MVQHDVGDREDVFDEIRRAERRIGVGGLLGTLEARRHLQEERAEDEPNRRQ